MIFIIKIKNNFKIIINLIFIFIWIFGIDIAYAKEFESAEVILSKEYIEWLESSEEEKEKNIMPHMYSGNFCNVIITGTSNDVALLVGEKINNFFEKDVSASYTDSRYNLNDVLDIDVMNQFETQCCWAIATLNSMQLNMQVTENKKMDFSERHMDYATSEDFFDGTNMSAFKRNVNIGGNTLIGLAYLTNGQGAVLEEDMPFENNMDKISINDIEKNAHTYVTDYEILPSIIKYYNSNGSLSYYDSNGNIYNENDVKQLRNVIKEHIIKYGGIVAYTAGGANEYYSSSDLIDSSSYYCNDCSVEFDHAVTIVGWDDNYSKDNFTGKAKPLNDGAYIVLNSYSDQIFEDGYIYISYDDVWIESALYGISGTSEIDYDKIYQHDNFGGAVPIYLNDTLGNIPQTLYYGSIFTRDTTDVEVLDSISVNNADYCKYDIYVNTVSDDLSKNALIKVVTTDVLNPGYHKIEFEELELTGDKFAVVIEVTSVNGKASLMIEPQMNNSFYEYVSADVGNSKISIDGNTWQNLADLGSIPVNGTSIDLSESDVCVKAFTKEKVLEENPDDEKDENSSGNGQCEIFSEKYKITDDKHIMKILYNTTINDLLKDIEILGNYKVYDKDGIEITDFETLTKTNMYLELEGEKYYFAVRADLNGDGKVSLIDLSRHLAWYNGMEEYELKGAYLKAADLNYDGRFSLIDLSQFIVLYNNM